MWGACDLVGCRTCRTEFLAPQPTTSDSAEIYGADYYAPWSAEAADTVDAMKRLTFAPMLDACEPAPGRSVLDLGCATGSFLAEAAASGRDDLRHRPQRRKQSPWRGNGYPPRTLHAGVVADRPFPDVLLRRGRDDRLHRARARSRSRAVGRPRDHASRVEAGHLHAARRFACCDRHPGEHWPQYREEHLTYFSRAWSRGLAVPHWVLESVDVAPTRKAITLAYAYGQAVAYPVPVLSGATSVAYRTLPALRHRTAPGRAGRDDGGRGPRRRLTSAAWRGKRLNRNRRQAHTHVGGSRKNRTFLPPPKARALYSTGISRGW